MCSIFIFDIYLCNIAKIKTVPENNKETADLEHSNKSVFEMILFFIATAYPVHSDPMNMDPYQKRNEIGQVDLSLSTAALFNCSAAP